MRALARLLAVVLGVTVLAGAARAAEPKVEERWFVIMMQGKKAGHAMSSMTEDAGVITTRTDMSMSIKRGDMNLKIGMNSAFVETTDGKPVRMESTMALGAAPVTSVYTWKEDGRIEVVQGKAKPVLRPAPKKEWKTPAAALRMVEEQLKKGETSITLGVMDAAMGLEVMTVSRTLAAREPVQVMGREVPGIRWTVKVDKPIPLEMVEYTDEAGEPIKSTINLGFIEMEQLLADKDLALAEVEGPELFVTTLVTMDRPIKNPREAESLAFRVRATSGDLPDMPSTGAQRVERVSASEAVVRVDLRNPVPDQGGAPTAGAGTLGASHMVDPADDALRPLMERAGLKGDDGPLEKADRLRAVVSRYIKRKDLSVGLASSGETVRTRTGDCTEHAVLLAALCRRAGVPARCASGLVYVPMIEGQENAFGYHMWTQVLAPDGQGGHAWVDVDATLDPNGPRSDATHITLEVSDMADDDMQNFMVKCAPLIGRLSIEVVE